MTSDPLDRLVALSWRDPRFRRWFLWWQVRIALRVPPWQWPEWFRITRDYYRTMERLVQKMESLVQ